MIECARENYDAAGMWCRGHAFAQEGNRVIEEGAVHSRRTREVDVNETGEWQTMGAVGDVPAGFMQGSPLPWVRAGGYALDAADALSLQSRATTTGQNLVTEKYTHNTLYDASDPNNWIELSPLYRSDGVLIGARTDPIWSNTDIEHRVCTVSSFGCSPAW